jgi:hypothetical protein
MMCSITLCNSLLEAQFGVTQLGGESLRSFFSFQQIERKQAENQLTKNHLSPTVGLEPTTTRLRALRSTN